MDSGQQKRRDRRIQRPAVKSNGFNVKKVNLSRGKKSDEGCEMCATLLAVATFEKRRCEIHALCEFE